MDSEELRVFQMRYGMEWVGSARRKRGHGSKDCFRKQAIQISRQKLLIIKCWGLSRMKQEAGHTKYLYDRGGHPDSILVYTQISWMQDHVLLKISLWSWQSAQWLRPWDSVHTSYTLPYSSVFFQLVILPNSSGSTSCKSSFPGLRDVSHLCLYCTASTSEHLTTGVPALLFWTFMCINN